MLCPTQSSNGAAIIKRLALGIVACIRDDRETPTLQAFGLNEGKRAGPGAVARNRCRGKARRSYLGDMKKALPFH